MQSKHVRRVDQLDAVTLDSELFILLNAQYRKAHAYLPNSLLSKIDPELDMLFRFFFRYLPLKYLGATFGQNIFELRYCNSDSLSQAPENKLRLLALISVCVPWIWNRIIKGIVVHFFRHDLSHFDMDMTFSMEQKIIILWKVLSLLNFCIFLQKSKFASIIERVLQIRPLYCSSQDIKTLQYDGVTKELLWHGLDEFLGFALPLINVYRVKNYFKRVWSTWSHNERFSKFRNTTYDCLICGNIPNFPHTIGCAHNFCYYCIASMLLADPNFICVECNFSANGIECIQPLPINKPTIAKHS